MSASNQTMSRLSRGLVVVLALVGLAGAAQVARQWESSAARMTEAAKQFMQSLSPDQRAFAVFPFASQERFAWHFVPLQNAQKAPTRKGLRLESMSEKQKQAALELIHSGLSEEGFQQVKTIFSLEEVLNEQEKGKGPVRHPGWYFFSLFGEPGSERPWGWRVDGHHIALNFTLDQGKITSITPSFLGANPGEVKSGARQGTRPLGKRLDLSADLVRSLSKAQQSIAKQEKPFGEVQGQTKNAAVTKPVGLVAADMQPNQQLQLRLLVEQYLAAFAADLADAERRRIQAAGWDKLVFAFSGNFEAGQPVTYRIQGPGLLIEFLNMQPDGAGNKYNHYHSSLRRLPTDFTP